MTDITINGGAIVIFSTLLGTVALTIPFLFKLVMAQVKELIAEKDRAHSEVVEALTTRCKDVTDAGERRELQLLDEVKFWRDETMARAVQQGQSIDAIKQGIVLINTALERFPKAR